MRTLDTINADGKSLCKRSIIRGSIIRNAIGGTSEGRAIVIVRNTNDGKTVGSWAIVLNRSVIYVNSNTPKDLWKFGVIFTTELVEYSFKYG